MKNDYQGGKLALSLRLATGKIKRYRTSYASLGENPIYHTKCGMFWTDCPKPEEECDHLDCALAAAGHETFGGLLFLIICILAIFVAGSRIVEAIFMGGWEIFFVAFGLLIMAFMVYVSFRSFMDENELTEFRDKGTIGGEKGLEGLSLSLQAKT